MTSTRSRLRVNGGFTRRRIHMHMRMCITYDLFGGACRTAGGNKGSYDERWELTPKPVPPKVPSARLTASPLS